MKFRLHKLNESYLNIMPKDIPTKEKYIDEVWNCMLIAYDYLGGPLKTKEDIMKDNVFWKIQKKNGEIYAVAVYKMDPSYGRKTILVGHNGTSLGRHEASKILYDDLTRTERQAWMEVSHDVERKCQQWGMIPIPVDVAQKILNHVKHKTVEIFPEPDGFHYSRYIGSGPEKKKYVKILYGNPPKQVMEQLGKKKVQKTFLTEDKVVKFEGKTYPDFGWCVIMCGAPASGKSTALDNLVPINAKTFNPDYLSEFAVEHGDIVGDNLVIGNQKYSLDEIKPPYNLKNSEYVSFLHHKLKPLNNKLKANMYKLGIDADKGRLPNLVFDIAGSDIKDLENIIFNLQPLGYKFCMVWVFNTLENVIRNNQSRDRTGFKELVISKYFDVLSTIPVFMRRQDLMQYINDFWLVLPVEYALRTRDDKYKYIKTDNVRKVNINNNVASLTTELADMVFDQQAEVLDKYRKLL